MDALHFIEEHLWMRASDEVTLKFHTQCIIDHVNILQLQI